MDTERNSIDQSATHLKSPPSPPASTTSAMHDHTTSAAFPRPAFSNPKPSQAASSMYKRAPNEVVYTGVTKWFDSAKGYGFITPDIPHASAAQGSPADAGPNSTDVFVHQTVIKADGFRSLMEGEQVEYILDVSVLPKLKAKFVTGPSGRNVIGAAGAVMMSGASSMLSNPFMQVQKSYDHQHPMFSALSFQQQIQLQQMQAQSPQPIYYQHNAAGMYAPMPYTPSPMQPMIQIPTPMQQQYMVGPYYGMYPEESSNQSNNNSPEPEPKAAMPQMYAAFYGNTPATLQQQQQN